MMTCPRWVLPPRQPASHALQLTSVSVLINSLGAPTEAICRSCTSAQCMCTHQFTCLQLTLPAQLLRCSLNSFVCLVTFSSILAFIHSPMHGLVSSFVCLLFPSFSRVFVGSLVHPPMQRFFEFSLSLCESQIHTYNHAMTIHGCRGSINLTVNAIYCRQ